MNNRQRLVQERFLDNEDQIIGLLDETYGTAYDDIVGKISDLDKSISNLQKVYAGIDDDGNLTGAALKYFGKTSIVDVEATRETLASMLQSKVYQKTYQSALKKQVGGVLDKMHKAEYTAVADYLKECYEDAFVGTMFDLHGQGIPLIMPMNQENIVRAVQLESKISNGLYNHIGENVAELKKAITAEVSRGIANGSSPQQIAQQIRFKMVGTYDKVGGALYRSQMIARTEAHRIQASGAMDACYGAKENGADVVKQWDSTLDKRTRESHRHVDGEIRELDEPFSNDLMFPGDPDGGAAEVVNCRCALLQRARWALDDEELETLKKRAEYFGLDKEKEFDKFMEKYMSAAETLENKYAGLSYTELNSVLKDKENQLKDLKARISQEELNFIMGGSSIEDMQKSADNVAALKKQLEALTSETDAIRKLWEMQKAVEKTDVVSLDMLPAAFRKTSANKKAAKTFVDALNDAEDLKPDVLKLYTNIDGLPNMPANYSVSYASKNYALSTWRSTRTGDVTKCKLTIPKMLGEDLTGQKCTAFHEMGHLIDLGGGNKSVAASQNSKALTSAIISSGSSMSDEIKEIIGDFRKEYDKTRDEVWRVYRDKRSDLGDEYTAGKITYSDYSKKYKALSKEEAAERDYRVRNLMGGGVTMLQDIYDALSGGKYRDNGTVIFGHGQRYYFRPGAAESEIFANYMSLSVNNPSLIDALRRDKPDLCDALDQLIKEMAGEIK